MSKPKRNVTTIADLVPDANNRRQRTSRNVKMIKDAIVDVGLARSIVIDEDNIVRAGNGVVAGALEAGKTKLLVVDADGDTLVAVRRKGLTEGQKRNLAIYDNRAGELSKWEPDQLRADHAAGLDLAPFFNEDELKKMLKEGGGKGVGGVKSVAVGDIEDKFWIAIRGPLKHQASVLKALRTSTKDLTGVDVELGTTKDEAWQP